jgi:2-oxoglutarate dehydrogenase E1 component
VLWEGQFGDFVNGAQVVIDQFISSGERKWLRMSGLVMLLPHGYEGQGPEHSSARMERFLQMAAQDNIQVVNCSTPAQIFHLLRRQVLRKVRDPLIVFTPKSLLRHPQAVSPLRDLANGAFQAVIPDGTGKRRVVFCSGKVYYDLLERRAERPSGAQDVALVRVEEIYPFPLERIREEIANHPGASLVWCQEEPRNMGPWPFVALELMEAGIRMEYAGRSASASPATGFHGRHEREQRELVAKALGQE